MTKRGKEKKKLKIKIQGEGEENSKIEVMKSVRYSCYVY